MDFNWGGNDNARLEDKTFLDHLLGYHIERETNKHTTLRGNLCTRSKTTIFFFLLFSDEKYNRYKGE